MRAKMISKYIIKIILIFVVISTAHGCIEPGYKDTNSKNIIRQNNYKEDNHNAVKEITKVEIYGTTWCSNCKKAKAYFANKEIPYIFYDIEKDVDANKRVKEYTSYFGVPIVIINGDVIEGYSPDSYEDYIK